MHIFYTPDINSDTYILSEEESKHCIKVLRLDAGSLLYLVDGKGGFYEALLEDPHPKRTKLKILSKLENFGKRNHYVHIAIAPTKNADRIEYFVEKCVEIGVDEITLIQTKHSERKNQKTERLEKIAISAMKQSLKAYLPKVNELMDFDKFIKTANFEAKFVAHLSEDAKPLKDVVTIKNEILLMIGPEGDFAQDEILLAQKYDFQLVTLGNSRLRTETAGVVACAIVNAFN